MTDLNPDDLVTIAGGLAPGDGGCIPMPFPLDDIATPFEPW